MSAIHRSGLSARLPGHGSGDGTIVLLDPRGDTHEWSRRPFSSLRDLPITWDVPVDSTVGGWRVTQGGRSEDSAIHSIHVAAGCTFTIRSPDPEGSDV